MSTIYINNNKINKLPQTISRIDFWNNEDEFEMNDSDINVLCIYLYWCKLYTQTIYRSTNRYIIPHIKLIKQIIDWTSVDIYLNCSKYVWVYGI